MKKIMLFICAIVFPAMLHAQDYYYSDKRKIFFDKADHWAVVQIRGQDRANFLQALRELAMPRLRLALKPDRGIYWLEMAPGTSIQNALSKLQERVNIIRTMVRYLT